MHKVADSIRSTHGQDGAIVLDVKQGQLFNLNPVGSRIFDLIEHGVSEAEIVNVISREFTTNKEVVANDVRDFINSLREHELLCD